MYVVYFTIDWRYKRFSTFDEAIDYAENYIKKFGGGYSIVKRKGRVL